MNARTLENATKRLREERIAVVNQVATSQQESIFAVRPVSCDLTHPGTAQRSGDAADLDATRLKVHHEGHEVPNEASPRDRFDREEIRGRDRAPMRLQERLPARRPLARGIDSILRQDSFDRVSSDGESEIGERALDPRVAPSRIVACHLEDQCLDLAGDSGPARAAPCAPVVLLGNELAVPAEQRIWGDNRRELAEPRSSERLCPSGEAPTLRIREAKSPSSELLPERQILGLQILDYLCLLAADPSDQQEQEELDRERHHDLDASRFAASHNRPDRCRRRTIKLLDFGMDLSRRSFGTIRGTCWLLNSVTARSSRLASAGRRRARIVNRRAT